MHDLCDIYYVEDSSKTGAIVGGVLGGVVGVAFIAAIIVLVGVLVGVFCFKKRVSDE